MPDTFISTHLAALDSPEACWNPAIWMCFGAGPDAYSEWARRLSTALILTCHHNFDPKRKKKRKKKSIIMPSGGGAGGGKIEGVDTFLGLCGSLCCREVGFAEVVLPALFLDMLLSGGDPSGMAREVGARGVYSMAEAVGIADGSFPHQQLSKCVGTVLQNVGKFNVEALGVVVDALDVLNKTTVKSFLGWGGFKKNPSTISGKVYPEETNKTSSRRGSRGVTEEEYNSGLGAPVRWEGLRHGVVLRLSGLAVAEAAVRANRPCSALMYLGMFCDNSFGGATECFEKVLTNVNFDPAWWGAGDGDIRCARAR